MTPEEVIELIKKTIKEKIEVRVYLDGYDEGLICVDLFFEDELIDNSSVRFK